MFAVRENKTLVELHTTSEQLEAAHSQMDSMKHEHEHLVGQIVELTLELEQAQAGAEEAAAHVAEANAATTELAAERDEWEQRFSAKRAAAGAATRLAVSGGGACHGCDELQAVQTALQRSQAECGASQQAALKAKALLTWRAGVQKVLDRDAQQLQQTTLVLRREVERLHAVGSMQGESSSRPDSDELATYRAQLQALQRQLLSTKAHYMSASRAKEQEHAELRGSAEQLRTQLRALSQRAEAGEEQMQRQLVRLQGENERLRYELILAKEGASAGAGGPPSPGTPAKDDMLPAGGRHELSELRDAMAKSQRSEQSALTEAEGLRRKARKLGSQVDRLQKQIAAEAALERVSADAARSEGEQLQTQVSR